MTDAQVKDFYDKMVKAEVVKAGLDYQEGLHDRVRLQGRRHGPEEVASRRIGGAAPATDRPDCRRDPG